MRDLEAGRLASATARHERREQVIGWTAFVIAFMLFAVVTTGTVLAYCAETKRLFDIGRGFCFAGLMGFVGLGFTHALLAQGPDRRSDPWSNAFRAFVLGGITTFLIGYTCWKVLVEQKHGPSWRG